MPVIIQVRDSDDQMICQGEMMRVEMEASPGAPMVIYHLIKVRAGTRVCPMCSDELPGECMEHFIG